MSRDILKEIKLLLLDSDTTMRSLVSQLNTKHNRNEAESNFHRKLSNGTIKFSEVIEIGEILGYDLVWLSRDEKTR